MQVAYYPKKLTSKKTIIILGTFENFHLAHLALLKKARTFGLPIGIVIINNINKIPKNLMKIEQYYADLEIRLQQLSNLKIDFCSVINFNLQFQKTSELKFLENLKKIFNYQKIIVGKDFRFGFQARSSYQQFPNDFLAIPIIKFDDYKISTSILKNMAINGEVETIRKLSAFPFETTIIVNKDLTFKYDVLQIKPIAGVYVGYFVYNNLKYFAVIKLGLNDRNVIKISNFEWNIYKQKITGNFSFYKMIKKIVLEETNCLTENDWKRSYQYLIELKSLK